jgi:hypothetical protein
VNNEWRPFPKQELALQRAEFEVLFGGSRGPGKTDCGLVWLIGEEYEPGKPLIMHPRYRALVIRKNADDLADWVDRAIRYFKGFGVDAAYKPTILRFPKYGSVIRTGHLKDAQSYTKYQGQEFPRMLIEELTQIPTEKRYLQLIASCRSTVKEIKPQIFSTTNPGGVGHAWVKKRFVDPAPAMTPFKDKTSGRSRIFIPATIDDNPILQERDPDYVRFLDSLKDNDEELYKAWRLGDWDTFAGQYFREFRRDLHVLNKPFTPRKDITKIAGLDWGRAKPFACLLAVLTKVTYEEQTFNRVIVYRENYGTEKKPSEWSQDIKKNISLTDDSLLWIQCDNQIFNPGNDMSMSIFEQFCEDDENWRGLLKPASKDRIGGWVNVHNWLSIAPDGLPYLMFAPDCINTIRTIPELIHDENKVEDLDSEGEDHAADALRYMLKGVLWIDATIGMTQRNKDAYSKHSIKPSPAYEDINLDDFGDDVEEQRDWRSI